MNADQERKAKRWEKARTFSPGRVLAWSGACLTGAAILGSLPAAADDGCEWTVISETVSPSREWSAIIRQVYCSNALSSGVTEIVQISRAGQAIKDDGEVLADDDGGNEKERPILTWVSDKTLQIDVPNLSLLGRYKREYQGIKVILKYNPDDPYAREIFYKKLGIKSP